MAGPGAPRRMRCQSVAIARGSGLSALSPRAYTGRDRPVTPVIHASQIRPASPTVGVRMPEGAGVTAILVSLAAGLLLAVLLLLWRWRRKIGRTRGRGGA